MRKIVAEAKTVELAIEKGLQMLSATREQVTIEVLEKETMLKKAKVELTLFETEEEKAEAVNNQTQAKQVLTQIKKASFEKKDGVERADLSKLENTVVDDLTTFLNDIMNILKIEGQVSYKVLDDDLYMIMEGASLGVLIGHHGNTLEAVQNLINAIIKNKYDKYKKKIFLDIENYRQKRIDILQALAKRMATKVVQMKKGLKLEPMNSFERRIIHSTLQEIPGLSTHSEGVEPKRYLVIDYQP